MPRAARIVIPDVPHHVTQKGNNGQDVFFAEDDRRRYVLLLKEESRRSGLEVLGYCLMTNHVHLVVVPHAGDALRCQSLRKILHPAEAAVQNDAVSLSFRRAGRASSQ